MVKQWEEFLGEKTNSVRDDVCGIQGELQKISAHLNVQSQEGDGLAEQVAALKSHQENFQKRLRELSKKMEFYKSCLARFHS